jgi:hypothetical protein
MFLYNKPINTPDQDRELVTWDNDPNGLPVAIPNDKENEIDIQIIEKKLNLN